MRSLAFIVLALSGVFWSLGFPLGKVALREMAAPHMVLLRFVVACAVALPFALGRVEDRALFRSPAVLAAGLFYGIAFLVQFEGLARTSVTLAALLVGAMPALIAASAWALGERVGRVTWAGVVAATLGAALIAGKPGGMGTPLGIALSLGSLLIFLAWLLVLRRAPAARNPLAIPSVTVVVATVAILPIALVLHGPPPLHLSAATWAAIVGQGVLSTFLATAAWAWGSARVGSASAGVFINVEPLMGAVLGVALFGDRPTFALILGGLLILVGSGVVVLGDARAGTPGDEAPPTPA